MDEQNLSEEITLEEILHIFKKRFWWFFITFVITVAVTIVYVFQVTPIYEASTSLKIESSKTSNFDIFSAQSSLGRSDISTEVELIKSRTNLIKVIDNLNLTEYFQQNSESDEPITRESIIKTLSEMISVSAVKDTNIVKISVQSKDSQLAKRIANELSKVYNELLKTLSKNEYTVKREFIEDQIPGLEKDLKNAEEELRTFKEKNNIFILDTEAKVLLDYLVKYDEQINTYNIQLEESSSKLKAYRDLLDGLDKQIISSETISINPVVSTLRSKIVELKISLAGLKEAYSSTDPKVIDVQEQLKATESELKNQVETLVTSQIKTINPDYQNVVSMIIEEETKSQVLKGTVETIEKLKSSYDTRLKELPALEQLLMELQRNLSVKENLYTILLEKLEETKIAEAGVVGTANIIDEAYSTDIPIKPNKKRTAAIGGVLGIFLGILIVFIIEYSDKSIKDEEEIKRVTKNNTVLGRIPHIDVEEDKKYERPELIVFNKPTSPVSESYKLLSTNINFTSAKAPKVITVTSSGPSEGKSILSSNIAVSYAQNGLKTVLIDCDMRKPRIEKVFKIEKSKFGIVNYILRDVPIERLIVSPLAELENFDVIPVGPVPPNPTALLTSPKFEQLINQLKEKYDKIVIDLPPILAAADALIASKQADGLVLVVRANQTKKPSLKIAVDNINTSGTKLIGTVVNDINERTSNYYYYYYYYYDQQGNKKKRKGNRKSRNKDV
ncbi:MAG: polysaccharide biosynthesis tyrosine autokinase [Thermotogae bacterium]|nr:polysaccharide biosynthesis tyrosine autokinase [Thermotogota bacterium]